MCKLKSEGIRCVADTRPAFDRFIAELRDTSGRFDRKREKIRSQFRNGQETAHMVVAAHAQNESGRKEILAARAEFADDPRYTGLFDACIKQGVEQETKNKAVLKALRDAKAKAERAERNSTNPLRKNVTNPETSLAHNWPNEAALWRPENNLTADGEPVAADEIRFGSNVPAIWQCPEGHKWETRLNNTTAALNRGTPLRCPDCTGRRGRSLTRMQEDLSRFRAAVGDDPEAWERLPPALRHALLENSGMLTGNRDDFSRGAAQALTNGDLTLREVMEAKKVEDIDQKVNEKADEDADADRTLDPDEEALSASRLDDADPATRIERIMRSAGAAELADQDAFLVERIVSDANESLWNEVHDNPEHLDALLTKVKEEAGDNQYRRLVAERFEDELNRVRNTPLPAGYQSTRTLGHGGTVEIEPNLMQRRFALLVEDRRRVANWSGTGAGKTESAMLAGHQIDADETIVFCPAPLVEQWADNYRAAWGDDVRTGLPALGALPQRTGRPRVRIISYDALSSDSKDAEARLDNMLERANLDLVTFDEIHRAKASDGALSQRNTLLNRFMDKASEKNPDLAVVGLTATPAINNLNEPKSILRLIQGQDPEGFATKPTVKNAARAYAIMAASGVRWKPSYRPKLIRDEVVVDITDRLPQVYNHVASLGEGKVNAESEPSYMEQALMREKAPKIVQMVQESDGPVLVYSHYTTGCVDTLMGKFKAAGIPAARFTGQETQEQREQILRDYQSGKYKALVGSKPISTGVDGLQHVSKRLIVASPPWTAADEEQLIGRLHRTGQAEDVHVSYVLTEAEVEGTKWSHCRKRLARVRYKRSLADAAVDGIIPEGELVDKKSTARKAFQALRRISGNADAYEQAA